MFVIIRNSTPEIINEIIIDNSGIRHPMNILSVWSKQELKNIGIYPVVDTTPAILSNQKLILDPPDNWIVHSDYIEKTYTIKQITEKEFNAKAQENEISVDPIVKKLLRKQLEQLSIPDEEINEYARLFPPFKVGETITQKMIDAGPVRRQYEGEVWQVKKPHTTQLDWLPPDVPALWKRVYDPETVQPWVQPTGAHDAYSFGDKVTHNDQTWISIVAGENTNTWEPGVYGWELDA